MFWKGRKNKDESQDDGKGMNLAFDLDRRQFFRVNPDPSKPVTFVVAGESFPVEDVSAGGFAFTCVRRHRTGQQVSGVLRLPRPFVPVALRVEVVEHTQKGSVRCRIVKIKDLDREKIHFYVLNRQKEELESRHQQKEPSRP